MSKQTNTKFRPFRLGQVVATPGACEIDFAHLMACLERHRLGDWGCVGDEDSALNNEATIRGYRLLSAYPIDPALPCAGHGDNCLWIITEADRSVTTFLLPEEY